jgi:hypothetical protein
MLRSGKSGAGIWVRRIEFARADSKQPTLSPTGPFTLEGWVNCDRITGATGGTVAMKGPDAEAPADRGALDWLIAQAEDCTTTLSTGAWNHVAMVYDGSTPRGYVNAPARFRVLLSIMEPIGKWRSKQAAQPHRTAEKLNPFMRNQ